MIVFCETNMYIAGCINLCNSDDEASESADDDRSACEEERVIMLFVLCRFKYRTVSQKKNQQCSVHFSNSFKHYFVIFGTDNLIIHFINIIYYYINALLERCS